MINNKTTPVNIDRWGAGICDPGFAGYNNPAVNPKPKPQGKDSADETRIMPDDVESTSDSRSL